MNLRQAKILLAVSTVLLLATSLAAAPQEYSYARVVRLSFVDGAVQVLHPESSEWEEAQINLPIRQGFQVRTASGRAEIEFESGATARLAEDSDLRFEELALSDGNRTTRVRLTRGTATFYANLSSGEAFFVDTPYFNVNVPENARFRVDVSGEGATVRVHKGDVKVEGREGTYRVTKNRALYYRATDEQVLLARAPEPDEWDRWVADRDEVLVASRDRSRRYVGNSGFSYGLSDLDRYGNWYNVAGYGWGWQPYNISINWLPYYHGSWFYFPGIGYTWHSYEPWGWLPYHFGHWVYTSLYGWVWLPGHFRGWHPGNVYFIRVNNRLCWGPRSPHDRPGDRPHNLPHGVVTSGGTPSGWSSQNRLVTRQDLLNLGDLEVLHDPGDRLRPIARAPRGFAARSGGAPAGTVSGNPGLEEYRGTVDGKPSPRGARPGIDRVMDGSPSGIVYDPENRRWVNSPNPPQRHNSGRGSSSDAATDRPPSGFSSGMSGRSVQPPSRTSDSDPPHLREYRGGSDRKPGAVIRPGIDRNLDESPASRGRSDAEPRSTSPKPTPQWGSRPSEPRNDSPRWSSRPSQGSESPRPAPRADSPRPPSPPPRLESPRPSAPAPRPAGNKPHGN